MAALAVAGTAGLLLSAHVRFGVGFATGAIIAILNYLWLHQIVVALVNAGTAKPPKTALAKVVLRYPLLAASVYLFYKTGWLPFTAVLAGFFVPVGGVLVEAITLLLKA